MILDHTFIFAKLHFIAFIAYLTNVNQIMVKALHIERFSELRNVGAKMVPTLRILAMFPSPKVTYPPCVSSNLVDSSLSLDMCLE